MNRKDIADIVLKKMKTQQIKLTAFYATSNPNIKYFYLDDLLPIELLEKANSKFPNYSQLSQKKSIRENKYVSSQMNAHDPILEELLYAFQDERIVALIQNICDIKTKITPDEDLYAGGLSLMKKDCFLNPHLDNSHDIERARWRALNLLFYVTPNWKIENGGNLELWPDGVKGHSIEILSKFNRLVVMSTHDASWHSVNKVKVDLERKCISNYYFSKTPLEKHNEFHVTTYKGRPDQKILNVLLNADSKLRMGIRQLFKNGIRKNPHIYKKED